MNAPPPASPSLVEAIADQADPDGFIALADFVSAALYHPSEGYYTKQRARVGRHSRNDFYTSSSFKAVFSEIITEAAVSMLEANGLEARQTDFVEIGAEPDAALLDGTSTPFASLTSIGIGQTLEIPPQAVVFSNELFDAQAFSQIRFDGQSWHEYGIRYTNGQFEWAPRPEISPSVAIWQADFPMDAPAGYTIDLPTGAAALASTIAQQGWRGAFIAFDYGKSWQGLAQDTPQGSARGYFQHQQLPSILEAPGNIDITHHICWDHLQKALEKEGFEQFSLLSQEAFIVRRAPRVLEKAFDPTRAAFDPVRRQLKELMHPTLMGHKFQALSGFRS